MFPSRSEKLVAGFGMGPLYAQRAELVTKTGLEAALLALEVRLVKWGIGIGLAVAGLLFAALRLTAG